MKRSHSPQCAYDTHFRSSNKSSWRTAVTKASCVCTAVKARRKHYRRPHQSGHRWAQHSRWRRGRRFAVWCWQWAGTWLFRCFFCICDGVVINIRKGRKSILILYSLIISPPINVLTAGHIQHVHQCRNERWGWVWCNIMFSKRSHVKYTDVLGLNCNAHALECFQR